MLPEEPTSPTGPTTPTPDPNPSNPVSKTGNVPRADIDFGNVAKLVSDKWMSMPMLMLLWKTQPVFAGEVMLFNTTVTERKSVGGSRKPLNQQLTTLHDEIDLRTENIKGYLEEKYEKAGAQAYYAQFGIVKQGDSYKLPHDRNERVTALQLMIDGCNTEGFNVPIIAYGASYWTTVKGNYEALVNAVGSIDSNVSGKVGTKNTLKKEIKKTLNALIMVLRGNYPDTWKNELRVWGFQKEKY
jgi:hypothetical protein